MRSTTRLQPPMGIKWTEVNQPSFHRWDNWTTSLKWSDLLDYLFLILSQTRIIIQILIFFRLHLYIMGAFHWSLHRSCFFKWQSIPVQLDDSCDWADKHKNNNLVTRMWTKYLKKSVHPSHLDKQHVSRNYRHTYWAQISIFLSVKFSKEKLQCGMAGEKKTEKAHQ